ncbi:hypothetical protein CYMTET_22657, partial [Cymbomonas tetramitiformis]
TDHLKASRGDTLYVEEDQLVPVNASEWEDFVPSAHDEQMYMLHTPKSKGLNDMRVMDAASLTGRCISGRALHAGPGALHAGRALPSLAGRCIGWPGRCSMTGARLSGRGIASLAGRLRPGTDSLAGRCLL